MKALRVFMILLLPDLKFFLQIHCSTDPLCHCGTQHVHSSIPTMSSMAVTCLLDRRHYSSRKRLLTESKASKNSPTFHIAQHRRKGSHHAAEPHLPLCVSQAYHLLDAIFFLYTCAPCRIGTSLTVSRARALYTQRLPDPVHQLRLSLNK
jgi:hypothetical protein